MSRIVVGYSNGDMEEISVGACVTGRGFTSIDIVATADDWSRADFQDWLRCDMQSRLEVGGILDIRVTA